MTFWLTSHPRLANDHDNCACHNGDSYNWRITIKACETYLAANYKVRSLRTVHPGHIPRQTGMKHVH
jgi:hypothetical protein